MAFTQLVQQQIRMFNKPADYTDVCEYFKDIDKYVNTNRTCYEGQVIYVKESETLYCVKRKDSLRGTMVTGKDAAATVYRNITGLYYTNVGFTQLNQMTLGENVKVELGTNGSVGGAETGYVFDQNMNFAQVLTKLVQKQIHPNYVKPTCNLSSDLPTLKFEIGDTINPMLTVRYIQNNGGSVEKVELYRNSNIVSNDTAGNATTVFRPASETLNGSDLSYKAVVHYRAGAYLKDNFGDDDPTGYIVAGSVTTNTITIKSYRNIFWCTDVTGTAPILSSQIRNYATIGAGKGVRQGAAVLADKSSFDFKIVVQPGTRFICICLPSNYSLKFVRASAQSNNDIKGNFNKTEVSVYGNNNTLATKYNVYTYIPNAAWNNVDELTVSV